MDLRIIIDLAVILILLAGISQFRTPRGARLGNLSAAIAMALAITVILYRNGVTGLPLVLTATLAGGVLGGIVAMRVQMIQIPAMVAIQNGAGGVAATLISLVELIRITEQPASSLAKTSALLGLIIGAATFSGSMVAAGKLANRLRQTPTILPAHNLVLIVLLLAIGLLTGWASVTEQHSTLVLDLLLAIAVAVLLGVVFTMRVGGADMPVLISFLNAATGLAGAFCGVAIGERLLIACGATVAASGSILTHVMCKAMNRSLATTFAGIRPQGIPSTPAVNASAASSTVPVNPAEVFRVPLPQNAAIEATESAPQDSASSMTPPANPDPSAPSPTAAPAKPDVDNASSPPGIPEHPVEQDPQSRAVAAVRDAQRVIIIPGYGMALADAQSEVVQLAEHLMGQGKELWYAIHPVAGRMPGHMHVLLAEAEADYGRIREMDDINDLMATTDLVLVVGACDVVNPAAIDTADTPISGMPILRAHEAKCVVVCNLDARPGYSGVENPLYTLPNTILLLGDAKATITTLAAALA